MELDLDMKKILKYLNVNFPVVLGGGAGKSQHFEELIFEKNKWLNDW